MRRFSSRIQPRAPSKRQRQAYHAFMSGDLSAMPAPKELTTQRRTPKKQAESAVNEVVMKCWRLLHGVLYRNRRGFLRLPNGGGFPYGLGPNGSGDTVGYTNVVITPSMVGKSLPIYTEFEAKTAIGRLEEHQIQRIEELRDVNAICGCVRSDTDAEALLAGWKERVSK